MEQRTKLFLTLLIGVAILHSGSLAGGFVWDDHAVIEENPGLDRLGNIPSFFLSNYFGDRANVEAYRPLVITTFALDRAMWGKRPFGYHLTNLLLHLAGGLLLYALLRRMSDRPVLPEAAALLFLVHPASAEPVAWIVGRGDLLAFVLLMATALAHLEGRRRPRLHALALLFWLAALFGKLAAAPGPLLILLVEWRRGDVARGSFLTRASLWRYGSYLVPLVVYCLARESALGTLLPQSAVGVTWKGADDVAVPFVAGAIITRYAFLILVPAGMCADYSADPVFRREEIVSIARSGPVVAMAVAAVVLIGVGLAARRRAPWLAFGLLWFLVALLPVAQVVRIGAVMADRYLYIPSAGAAAALAAGVLALPRWRIPLGAALLACMAALTVGREAVWRSDLTMNRDVLQSYPGHADAWNRVALYWAGRGDVRKEEAAYRRGLELSPGNRFLRKNLGWLLHQRGEDRRAIEELGRAFTLPQPQDLQKAKIAYALARSMIAVGEDEGAAPVLEEAVLCRPPFAPAFELLGRLYRDRLDRPERAESLLRRAESIRENAGIRAPKRR